MNPYADLSHKVAIVTGGAQGIGRAICQRFAEVGMHVIVADIAQDKGERTRDEIIAAGGSAEFRLCNVEYHSQIRDTVEAIIQQHGRLDVVVNNAYWSVVKDVVALEEAEWDKGMDVMLKAAYLFGKHAFPHMLRNGGGAMINIASIHGLVAAPRYPVYAAAKAGLIHLTRQMAIDGGQHNIRVNAICPGWIFTESMTLTDENRRMAKLYPRGRPGEPIEIANVALFLASSQASFVNGQAICVDGGLTAQIQEVEFWWRGVTPFIGPVA